MILLSMFHWLNIIIRILEIVNIIILSPKVTSSSFSCVMHFASNNIIYKLFVFKGIDQLHDSSKWGILIRAYGDGQCELTS